MANSSRPKRFVSQKLTKKSDSDISSSCQHYSDQFSLKEGTYSPKKLEYAESDTVSDFAYKTVNEMRFKRARNFLIVHIVLAFILLLLVILLGSSFAPWLDF